MAIVRDFSEAQIAFEVSGLDVDRFQVTRVRGVEGISRLYRFVIELASEAGDFSFENVLQKPAVLRMNTTSGERLFHGLVSRFEVSDETTDQLYFHAEFVPLPWLLTNRYGSRIFQAKSVPDIVRLLLTEGGMPEDRIDLTLLTATYNPLEYCVQYRETDYNFICRLMEKAGIWWYIKNTEEGHSFVAADSLSAYTPIEGEPELPYHAPTGMNVEVEHVYRYRLGKGVRPGAVVLSDFNFENPALNLQTKANLDRDESLEFSDYPGDYTEKSVGLDIATRRTEEFESSRTIGVGLSNCGRLAIGKTFDLIEHPCEALNGSFVITALMHEGRQGSTRASAAGGHRSRVLDQRWCQSLSQWLYHGGQVQQDMGSMGMQSITPPLEQFSVAQLMDEIAHMDVNDDDAPVYECRFECIPSDISYRPPRVSPVPVMRGSQTARVVGPEGEEIHTDEYGRVKVQFNWDRVGEFNDQSSCWIRVSQGMAGGHYGMMFLPRIGQEVIVDFLEGDPDKPIVTGRVYNADHMPPYNLPDEKTKSTIKSRSSIGGGGFNEIRFEDLKDKEQIFIHAQKDLDLRVRADQRAHVGNDKHAIIKRDQKTMIERDEHRTVNQDMMIYVKRDQSIQVDGDRKISIAGDHSVTVVGDVGVSYSGKHSLEVGGTCTIKASEVIIDGSAGVTIKSGGSFVKVDAGGVTISGPLVKLNSGGSGGSPSMVTAVAPQLAEEPDVAATGDPGEDTTYTRDPDDRPWHDSTQEDTERHWIGIRLWDDNGEPMPGERYEITLPDGTTVARGTTNQNGEAYVRGIDPGSCDVTFPNLDAETWEAGPATGGEGGENGAGAGGSSTPAPSGAGL